VACASSLAFAAALTGCGSSGGGAGTNAGAGSQSAGSLKGTLSVLYTNNYMFDTDQQANKWWSSVKSQFEKKYPGATLKLLGTGGTDIDEMNKAALLFRSPSQTPDVVQMPTTYVSQFASSDYLAPLNNFVSSPSKAPFWSGMPKAVQDMGMYNGQIYAVNNGNNDFGIFYNKQMFKKAGLPLNWKPKNWNDILVAARAIKAKVPGVAPLWLGAGVAAGPTNVLQGIGNLIDGSAVPTMFDAKTNKWVVGGSGLNQVLSFYKSVYSEGLGAPTSQLFSPEAVGNPPQLMQKGKLAITIAAANYYPSAWVAKGSDTYWPQAGKIIGVAPMPTVDGQAPDAVSTLGGWAIAVSAHTKHMALAEGLIKIMMAPHNQLLTAVWSGFVPPDTSVGESKAFVDSAPFQAAFNQYAKYGAPLPTDPNFPVYARALNTATGDIVQNPSTSVAAAEKTISSITSQQLGSDKVESLSH
jgi:multiple sugar transport system substrate-binding protein